MNTAASRRLVLDYYAALASRDPGAIEKLLSDDVEWIPPQSAPLEGPFRGRDVVLREMRRAGARFFDLRTARAANRKIVADGDTVIVLQTFTCKAANGHDYSNEYVWIFTCAGGRIVRMEEHTDTLRFQRIVMDG